jgi:hypothetical protein
MICTVVAALIAPWQLPPELHPLVALPVIPREYAITVVDPSTVAHAVASAKKPRLFMGSVFSSTPRIAQRMRDAENPSPLHAQWSVYSTRADQRHTLAPP